MCLSSKKQLKCFLTIHLPQTHKASAKKAKKVNEPHLPTVLLRGVVKNNDKIIT
jgi:hypothetical protein